MAQDITYDEVSCIFFANQIWSGEDEFRWYRWCWEVLGKNGLTRYSSGYEKSLIYVRAYTLYFIYAELCDYLANEYFSYEVMPDEDLLPAAWLGYILARTNDLLSGEYDLHDMQEDEMLELCVNTQRAAISRALTDIQNGPGALMMFMHATFDAPLTTEWDEFYNRLDREAENALNWLNMGAFQRGLFEY